MTAPDVPAVHDRWRCGRCGSRQWVAVSLNRGRTRTTQCVPCGTYSPEPSPEEARAVPADLTPAANKLVSLDDLVMDVDAQIDTILRRVADRHYANKSGPDDDWLAWACSELRQTRQQLAAAAGSEVREEWGVRESASVSGFGDDEDWARTVAGGCGAPDHVHAPRSLVRRTVSTSPWEVVTP